MGISIDVPAAREAPQFCWTVSSAGGGNLGVSHRKDFIWSFAQAWLRRAIEER
jgi:hypothetical protein